MQTFYVTDSTVRRAALAPKGTDCDSCTACDFPTTAAVYSLDPCYLNRAAEVVSQCSQSNICLDCLEDNGYLVTLEKEDLFQFL